MTWSKDIFAWWTSVPQSHRDPDAALRKASKEFDELIDAHSIVHPGESPQDRKKRACIEAADTIICLSNYIEILGFDAAKTVAAKLEILKKRKWEVMEDGTLQHVKEDAS